jgi:antibiotic biosynthesis monooxygenase (ABM) superfamily enzyme
MIARIWHGWTTTENADSYESLLKEEVFPSIEQKKVKGYSQINLLRRPTGMEVEFITIMYFENLQAVIDFAGEDYEKSYVIDKARKLLAWHDETSQHYEVKHVIDY